MTDVRLKASLERPRRGVFEPSRAEIAREMRCRLALCSEQRDPPRQPTASRH